MEEYYKYYIEKMSYNPIKTLKDLMKDKKVMQKEISKLLKISQKSINKYLNGKTKLTKKFLLALCCMLETPSIVALEIFYISNLRITLLKDDLKYYKFIIEMEKRTKKENIEKFFEEIFK